MLIGLRIFTVFVLWVPMLSGCVSKSKYLSLEENTAARVSQLQDRISTLGAQNEKLEKEIENKILEIKQTNEQVIHMERKAGRIKAEKEKEADELKAQKDAEIARLKGTYENLVTDLKSEIEKGEIKVTQIKDKLSVNLVEKILFDSGRAEVKPKGKEILQKVGNILQSVHDKEIRIEGHTDNVPIGGNLKQLFPTNWELSTQRATNVLRFLQEGAGLEGKYLSSVGYGEFRPIATNETTEGRAENRRIEIVLVPLDIQGIFKKLE